jgi:transposase/DNA-binding XRE family transcriptional regulator
VLGVIGGVDTHADTIHVALIDEHGRAMRDQEFPTTPAGYRAALAFLIGAGKLLVVGVEGTSSYGIGLTRAAQAAGIEVREVTRPDRAQRRRRGKSDPIDAYEAARAVLAGRAESRSKTSDIDPIRALFNARRSAVKARQAAQVQIRQQLVTAPVRIREKYRDLSAVRLLKALAACRPSGHDNPDERCVLLAMKMLAQRHQYLAGQVGELERELRHLILEAAPHLLEVRGVGVATAAQLLITAGGNPDRLGSEASFAALCGAAPVPASSGKTTRHRLSRGGDRGANYALHVIATVRLSSDPRTKEFADRQRAKGRSNPEILRLLKRAIAREAYKHLTRPRPATGVADLRDIRRRKNISQSAAAAALNTSQMTISRTERGQFLSTDLTNRYRAWLNTA